MLLDPSGAEVQWDWQLGTFTGHLGGVAVGRRAGEILTVADLQLALGVSLAAETGADLQAAYLEHPYTAEKRYVSKLQFMDLFRPESLVAIYTAAKTDVNIQIALDRVNRAPGDRVELTDFRTLPDLQRLEQAGLIPAGDAARIQRGEPWH